VNQFVPRDAEMRKLEQFFLHENPTTSRRRVFVVHGLGGMGKTQLAVEFARGNQSRFSAIFWLDGSSENSLKQSFVDMVQRLPREDLTADGVDMLQRSNAGIDMAVKGCLRWLSIPSNHHWLLIFDNVDCDYHDKNDSRAYNFKNYFPPVDRGSILITSRLASLQRDGSGFKLGTVNTEQARTILENNAGKVIEGESAIDKLVKIGT
jgi:hypothetical protein